jgi:energy-coupling factor transporter ATP-binding protein EcfA2
MLQERGSNLSQGQRQLISFSRAVLSDPRILILDEATANIDTQTEVIIQQALKLLLKGRTSLVIAHRLSTIHDANLVVVMENGKIVEMGNHKELIEKKGIYYHLYTMMSIGIQSILYCSRIQTFVGIGINGKDLQSNLVPVPKLTLPKSNAIVFIDFTLHMKEGYLCFVAW